MLACVVRAYACVARACVYERRKIAKQAQRDTTLRWIFQKGNYKRAGNEREGNKEKSLRHVAFLRLEFQREEIDKVHRDISTLFIELRNLKIKSCHCNHANKTYQENEKNQSLKGFQVWRLLRNRMRVLYGIFLYVIFVKYN